MKGMCVLLLAVVAVFPGCTSKTQTASAPGDYDSAFVKLSDKFLDEYLAWRPSSATALGLHSYDRYKRNYHKPALEAEITRLKLYEKNLTAFAVDSLSPILRQDHATLLAAIRQELFSMQEIGAYSKNPMTYAGMFGLNIFIQRDFALLEERIRSIVAIEDQAPDVFAAARENLDDSLARPFVETAIEIAEGTASFLEKELAQAVNVSKDESLKKTFAAANQKTVEELRRYVAWLQKEKLPKVHGHYAIGKDNYSKMLLYHEMLTTPPEEILEMGLKELKREQALFAAVAAKIDPKKKPMEILAALNKEHPSQETLIPDTKKNLESIRQFLIDRKIISLPSEVRVAVQETPAFARATSTASMDTPGPFEKATQAYYYITPTEKSWTAKQKEEWLSQFNYYVTDIISIHEAYPGHYVQFLHVNASGATKIQKIFGSYAFVEGWAHYTEKMMIEEGFGDRDSVRQAKYHLAQLSESLLRLCRLCVSVKTHCERMTIAEGTKFLQDNCYYEYKPAYQEALRGTFDPGYLSYTLGKLQILKLREDYKAEKGADFSLQKFHDELLSHGMPPVEYLRTLMLQKRL